MTNNHIKDQIKLSADELFSDINALGPNLLPQAMPVVHSMTHKLNRIKHLSDEIGRAGHE